MAPIERINPHTSREKLAVKADLISTEKADLINRTAFKINEVLNLKGPEWVNRSVRAAAIIEGVAKPGDPSTNKVSTLIDAADSGNRIAQEQLSDLTAATYIAISGGRNEELKDALKKGSAMEIDALLPITMQGLGEEVRNIDIQNLEIRNEIDRLDRAARVDRGAGEGGKDNLRIKLNESLNMLGIISEKGLSEEDQEEMDRVSAYIGWELMGLNEANTNTNTNGAQTAEMLALLTEQNRLNREMMAAMAANTGNAGDANLERLVQIEEAQARLREQIAERSLKELMSSYLGISAPRERAPQPWEHDIPAWAEGFSIEDWRDLLSMEDSLLGAVYQKRHGPEYSSVKGIGESWGSMMDLKEEDLKKWCEDPLIRLNDVMHEISRELLVPQTFTEMVDGKRETSKIYVFETDASKRNYTSEHVKQLAANQTTYKDKLADRLVRKGIIKNKNLANFSVAMAMDVMEIGGVFSLADTLRKMNWEAEGVRFGQRPDTKIIGKLINDEIIGGPWGLWAKAISKDDVEASEILLKLKVVPKLLAGSFMDVKSDRSGKSWSDRIYDGEGLDLSEDYGGVYFNWRKDSLAPACTVMSYLTQKNALAFKSITEVDNTVSAWMGDLRNSFTALRKNGVSLLTTEIVAATIGASTNLYPIKGHYLRIGTPGAKFANSYKTMGAQIIEGLLLSENEMDYLRDFYSLGALKVSAIVAPAVNSYGYRLVTGQTKRRGR